MLLLFNCYSPNSFVEQPPFRWTGQRPNITTASQPAATAVKWEQTFLLHHVCPPLVVCGTGTVCRSASEQQNYIQRSTRRKGNSRKSPTVTTAELHESRDRGCSSFYWTVIRYPFLFPSFYCFIYGTVLSTRKGRTLNVFHLSRVSDSSSPCKFICFPITSLWPS